MITALPSRAQGLALFAEYHSTRSLESRNKIVVAYMPQVEYLASMLHSNLPSHVQLDDLVSWGVFGLMQAIEKFDPSTGTMFHTFASLRIRGSMLDEIRKNEPVPRLALDRTKRLERAREEMTQHFKRPATPIEVRDRLGINDELFRETESNARMVNSCTSLDREFGDERRTNVIGAIADDSAEKGANAFDAHDIIQFVLHRQGVSAALLLRCLYVEGETMVTAGEWLGVTPTSICTRHKKILKALRSRFAA